ncbi:MAG: oligosaccharide flippase family protein [Cyanobacteria bacterium]|jgi:O-antigen/teichoic acid export membrane protein|nr:oligosaccharide flippase family protein [Cyanobacteria bacterium GSL.Bin1]
MSSNSVKAIIKGSFWVTLAKFITRLAGLLVLPFLARLLDPAAFGVYSLLHRTVQTGDNFSRLGVDVAVQRNGAQHQSMAKEEVGRLFGVGGCLTIGSAALLTLGLCLGNSSIATYFLGEPKIATWLPLVGLTIFVTASSNVPSFYLTALHAFRLYSLRDSITVIVGALITVILTSLLGLSGAIYGLLVTALIRLLSAGWFAFNLLHQKKIKLRFDLFFQEARSILNLGLPFYLANFLSNFITLPLLGWLTRLGGIEQVGYLRVAQSLSQLVSFIPTTVGPVMISYLSASFASNFAEYQKLKSIHLRTLWGLSLLVSIFLCFSLDILMPALFGVTYDQAIPLSRITIWIVFVNTLSGVISQSLISAGNTRTIAIWKTKGLFIMMASAFLMIPRYQATGFLLAQAFGSLFTLFGYGKLTWFNLSNTDQKRVFCLALTTLLSVALAFIVPYLFASNLILLFSIKLFIIITLIRIIILASFYNKEFFRLRKLISNKLFR